MLLAGQKELIISTLAEMLMCIDRYRDKIQVDVESLGIELDLMNGYQPDLADNLRRWHMDPVGQAIREGIRKLGSMVGPHASMDDMVEIAESASKRSQNHQWSIAIIEHAWDGLKSSDQRTWLA